MLYHLLLSKEEMVRITLGVRTRRRLDSPGYAGGAILACSKQEKKKSNIPCKCRLLCWFSRLGEIMGNQGP